MVVEVQVRAQPFEAYEPALTRRDKHLHAVICCVTRRRPQMLKETLVSLAGIAIPKDTAMSFIVVENDDADNSAHVLNDVRPKFDGKPLVYRQEPELGIPFARNAAVRAALELAADVILFIDDDEIVAENWLERMVEEYRDGRAVLIGGPVAPQFESEPKGRLDRIVRSGLIAVFSRYLRKTRRRLKRGQEDRVTVFTGNWLCAASVFLENEIFFDTSLRFAGGSDTQFFKDVRAAGLPTGWACDAFAFETVPDERVTLTYQYRRAEAQSKTSFRAKMRTKSRLRLAPGTCASIILRSGMALISVLMLPFTKGRSIIDIARHSGWVAGRIGAFLGGRSQLYTTTTGH